MTTALQQSGPPRPVIHRSDWELVLRSLYGRNVERGGYQMADSGVSGQKQGIEMVITIINERSGIAGSRSVQPAIAEHPASLRIRYPPNRVRHRIGASPAPSKSSGRQLARVEPVARNHASSQPVFPCRARVEIGQESHVIPINAHSR